MKKVIYKSLNNLNALILFVVLILNYSNNLIAQESSDTTRLYNIRTKSGNEFMGSILHEDLSVYIISTEYSDSLVIKKESVQQINEVSEGQIVNGEYWFENPQSSRYFWMPNGYGLKQGEGYYQNILLFFNQVSYGLSDNITVGLGTIPFFLVGFTSVPFWLTPKVSIPLKKDKFNIGAGALIAGVTGLSGSGVGMVYGVSTYGTKDKNISLGLGYGYAGSSWAKSPTINISAMHRIGAKGYFIMENYIINANGNYFGFSMFGARTMLQRISFDYGFMVPIVPGLSTTIALPWGGITIPFGNY